MAASSVAFSFESAGRGFYIAEKQNMSKCFSTGLLPGWELQCLSPSGTSPFYEGRCKLCHCVEVYLHLALISACLAMHSIWRAAVCVCPCFSLGGRERILEENADLATGACLSKARVDGELERSDASVVTARWPGTSSLALCLN